MLSSASVLPAAPPVSCLNLITPALGLVASISNDPCAFTFAVKSAAVPVAPPPAPAIPLRAILPPVTPLFSLSTSKTTDVPSLSTKVIVVV